LATVGALVVLPALLACVAPHLDRWRLPITQAEVARHGEYAGGGWHRLASAVMRRPVVMGGGALLLLLVLGAPFLSVSFGLPDYRVLPAGTAAREVQEAINRGFVPGEGDNLFVVQRDDSSQAPTTGQIDAYASALSGIPNVARVDAASGSYVSGHKVAEARGSTGFLTAHRTWLSVVPATEPLSAQGEQLVSDVRDLPAPFPIQVGGSSAQFTDTKTALFSRLPTAFGLIAAVTFCLLFLFTASVLIPLKGLVLNVLSLTATFGAMVWVFQDGHLSGLLDFTPTGMLDTNMPILMFCVVFGLSMDYEVFLLSRIKEHYDATGNNDEAIAAGIQHTGRLITSAAALLATTFFAFAASGVSFVKLMGVGIALAVVVDATIVRAVLVPAFMRLAGPANWWSPAPLRVLHKVLVRGDIHGSDVPVAEHV
jgi:RND superfamily putative drug exporter